MGASKVISVWLPVELIGQIDDAASRVGLTRNKFIRTMLEMAVSGRKPDSFGHDGLDSVVVE